MASINKFNIGKISPNLKNASPYFPGGTEGNTENAKSQSCINIKEALWESSAPKWPALKGLRGNYKKLQWQRTLTNKSKHTMSK